tara:strand:+ start:429 stop:1163 length:735 start_codon:yes stop_codon:yes gene_type:complete
MDLKRVIYPKDLTIYDELVDLTRDKRKAGYNIGDLLHIPVLANNPNFRERDGRQQVISEIYKDSIFSNYWNSRPENESIPHIPRIIDSVQQYVNKTNSKYTDIYDIARKDTTLCVHTRSGDLDVTMDYINVIKKMSKCFDTVIILGGVHFDQVFRTRENKIRAFIHQTNLILEQNHNIYSFLEKPDVHIAIMSQAKHLLVHYGGFSAIGAIVCSGNVYSTSRFHHPHFQPWKQKVKKQCIQIKS